MATTGNVAETNEALSGIEVVVEVRKKPGSNIELEVVKQYLRIEGGQLVLSGPKRVTTVLSFGRANIG